MKAIQRRIRRWRREGPGRGASYRPWITVRGQPARGESHRVLGFVTGRLHHLLSRIEFEVFLLLDDDRSVLDIREQFPLIPRGKTEEIARRIKARHPCSKHHVMTTDFLVTRSGPGGLRQFAVAVKTSKKLGKRRVLGTLEIERRYWSDLGISWVLVTERELDPVRIANLRWLALYRFRNWSDFDVIVPRERLDDLFELLKRHASLPLAQACLTADHALDVPRGSALTATHLALANRLWRADLGACRYPLGPLRGLAREAADG